MYVEQQTLFKHVQQVLRELLGDDLGQLRPETDLKADLHIDSTMAIEVAFRLSRRLDREIPFEHWFVRQAENNDFSIGALIAFLQAHLRAVQP